MKEYFEKLKHIELLTHEPDSDWKRVVVLLMILTVFSLGWSTLFFFQVRKDIAATEKTGSATLQNPLGEKEQEIKAVFEAYEKRRAEHSRIRNERIQLGDPSVF